VTLREELGFLLYACRCNQVLRLPNLMSGHSGHQQFSRSILIKRGHSVSSQRKGDEN
jgi:hypothetical protein